MKVNYILIYLFIFSNAWESSRSLHEWTHCVHSKCKFKVL